MRAILIDPHAKKISEIDIEPGINALYKALDCGCIDRARLAADVDAWVDDEGLYREGQAFFSVIMSDQLIAGKALLMGHDDWGNTTPCPDVVQVHDLKKMITFHGDAQGAELAIKLGFVERPYSAINGERFWEWHPAECE